MTKSLAENEALAQIDRLVINELSEGERTALLAWLDEEPFRWRRCGLAFLEAQMWEQATARAPNRSGNCSLFDFAESATEISIAAPDKPAVEPAASSARDGHSVGSLPVHYALVAALLLIAFAGGIGLERAGILRSADRKQEMAAPAPGPTHPPTSATDSNEPMIATVSVRTNLDPERPLQLQVPVTAADPNSFQAGLSEADRRLWEKRGFEVHEERRLLPAKLPDGREVAVPVNKVRLKYRGAPVS